MTCAAYDVELHIRVLGKLAAAASRAAMLLGRECAVRPILDSLGNVIDTISSTVVPGYYVQSSLAPLYVVPQVPEKRVAQRRNQEIAEAAVEYSGERLRVLLLEVLRRAAYDWVLYRGSRRLDQRSLAHDAYVWLFEEEEGHPWYEQREEEDKQLTSFEAICDILDFDTERVRDYVRKLTPDKIKTAGRPPERRKRQTEDSSYYTEHDVTVDYTIEEAPIEG